MTLPTVEVLSHNDNQQKEGEESLVCVEEENICKENEIVKTEEERNVDENELEEGEIVEDCEEDEDDGDGDYVDEDGENEEDNDNETVTPQKLSYSIEQLKLLKGSAQMGKEDLKKFNIPSFVSKDSDQNISNAKPVTSNSQNNRKKNKKGPQRSGGNQNNNNSHLPNLPRQIGSSNPNAWKVPDRNVETEEGKRKEFNRLLNGMLNKITLENFESISKKMIDLIESNKSQDCLVDMINSTFEKALGEPKFSMVYSKLCFHVYYKLDRNDNPAGFRKLLLNKCQEEFNNRVTNKDLTEEEYVKDKRKYLGNIKFIGELFLVNLLPVNIILTSVGQLLSANDGHPDEEDLESLCKLLSTTGKTVEAKIPTTRDSRRYTAQYEEYFTILHSLIPNVSNRIKYLILDLEDLRKDAWVPRRKFEGPMKIAEVRAMKSEEKLQRTKIHSAPSSPKRSNSNASLTRSSNDAEWNVVNKGGRAKSNHRQSKDDAFDRPNHNHHNSGGAQWKAKSSTSIPQISSKNAFTSLELEKPKKEVSFAKPKVSLKGSFKDILDEYFNSLEHLDTKESLLDLNLQNDAIHEFISLLFTSTTKKDRIIPTVDLIQFLLQENLLNTEFLEKGVKDVFEGIEEILEDCPNATIFYGEIFARLISSEKLSYKFMNELLTNSDLAQYELSKLVIQFLKTSVSIANVEDVVSKIKDANFDIFSYVLIPKLSNESDLTEITEKLRNNE